MSSKQGRNRNSGAVADLRKDDPKGHPEKSKPSSPTVPISFEYETEDGLTVSISADSASISREYELSESDSLEFSVEADWNVIDVDIERSGGGTGVSGSVGLPGDVLGFGGGAVVDLATGEITGGDISVEVGTVAVEVSVGDSGCSVSMGIRVMGFGVTYSRDICNDEDDDDDDDRESRVPRSDDEWSGPEAKEQIEDMSRRFKDFGGCGGGIYFWSFDYSSDPYIFHPSDPSAFFIRGWVLDEWGFRHEYFNPHSPYFEEENGATVQGQFEDNLIEYQGRQGRFVLDPSQWNVKRFNQCMPKLYPDRKPIKKPPPPSKPPMREKECCDEVTKMVREIHKALAVRELLDNQLIVPTRLIAPNAKGNAKLKNYLDIAQWQMRMQDHLGIHPFKALVTDVNAAKKGNQKVEVQAMNATSAVRQIMELLLENKGDSATRLNLQVRTAVAVGQILNAVSICAKSIEQVANFLGMPTRQKILKVKMPFDFTFGKGGKGFGKSKSAQPSGSAQNQLDLNSEESTEALLPKFMQDKEQPIVVEMFDGEQGTLLESIQKMNQ